ncbi:flagella synthesis protein FlgN [Chitinibacter sp. S2-10]|uniref:flagella synthesis protein FlgN n=1 Tax=Chitinibacter sp. S2-10 TaxID=3373597 RepID=UPI003977D9D0
MSDSTLHQLLAAELVLVQQLSALLTQEQDALIKRQLDLVSQLIDTKNITLQNLEQASKARVSYCVERGLQSVEQIESSLGEQTAIWHDLQQGAKLAEIMNRTNGQLIKTHEEINQHFMNALAQQRNEDLGYSADGRLSQLSAIGRPFDRA